MPFLCSGWFVLVFEDKSQLSASLINIRERDTHTYIVIRMQDPISISLSLSNASAKMCYFKNLTAMPNCSTVWSQEGHVRTYHNPCNLNVALIEENLAGQARVGDDLLLRKGWEGQGSVNSHSRFRCQHSITNMNLHGNKSKMHVSWNGHVKVTWSKPIP